MLEKYLNNLQELINRGDAREESFYTHLETLLKDFASKFNKQIDITILPKKTESGNPDFRIWDGKVRIIGYIEAKEPNVTNLDYIENAEQLVRYRTTFPNLILTNFYEFRLYRNGERIKQVTVGRQFIAQKLNTAPVPENEKEFEDFLSTFFSFSLPKIESSIDLASELAKRTRFLRDEVVSIELAEEEKNGRKAILGFYEAFRKYLLGTLTKEAFADLYSQTITYGLFAARTRCGDSFNRELAFKYIPNTIGILRDVFRFISLEDPPIALQIIVDDIAEVLNLTDVNKILQDYYEQGKGQDPVVHFYETFLSEYDPKIREKRGVYYTPEPVVKYIVHAIHKILKTHFDLPDGLADNRVTLLDPAAGTLTFLAEAIRTAINDFINQYGQGGITNLIRNHILQNFYAFELMMAPYAIGHLKISLILEEEYGYKFAQNERFKLYLTNTLEMQELERIQIPGLSSLSDESHLAIQIKQEQPILVILGNPPYSGHSANQIEWAINLVKENYDGLQSYYVVDGKPLDEKNPKWLQDDYVKFLRFAQWKIHKAGFGIVGMITNHSYLDNPTFRGMRQSLMKTFNEIYILDLHGNSLKKETCPDGSKDENVFDIRQGTAIAIFIKQKGKKGCKVYHADLFGTREHKYQWLSSNEFSTDLYNSIKPETPFYFFVQKKTEEIRDYLSWMSINKIFPVNSVGVVTSRDEFVVDFDKRTLENRIRQLKSKIPDETLARSYGLFDKKNWKLNDVRNQIKQVKSLEEFIVEILYRPFDKRYIFYHSSLIERTRPEVMKHMFEKNIGLITIRRSRLMNEWRFAFVTDKIISGATAISSLDINYLYPLYLYNNNNNNYKPTDNSNQTSFNSEADDTETKPRKPNIDERIFEKLNSTYKRRLSPEEILYYIYGILYSNIYRQKFAEFLKIDFPKIPFTSNYDLFNSISNLGKQLVELHLLISKLLDYPIVKYQGVSSNDKIEKIDFKPKEGKVFINNDKYFEGITPELWNYYIGGYQVLQKYLKDRKGKTLEDPRHYCRMATAIAKTIELQNQLDGIYPLVESDIIVF